MASFGGGGQRRSEVTLLPDPEPREARFTVISTDDHVVEPPHMWEGRFPAQLADQAPRVVASDDGGAPWLWNDALIANAGVNAVAGRPPPPHGFAPPRFDALRPGA